MTSGPSPHLVTTCDFARMMRSAARRIREQHCWLSQLDSIGGDGDHGSAMLRTVEKLEQAFDRDVPADLKSAFHTAGWTVLNSDGGASSALLGAFFLGMGDAANQDLLSWNCAEFAASLNAGLCAVQSQTEAQPGDKTMMDALIPAVSAFTRASELGQGIVDAIAVAAEAAKNGAEATANLTSRYGRARLLGQRTVGHQDPGAASVALIFEGFFIGITQSKGNALNGRH